MEFGRDVFIDLLDTENTVITKAMNLVLRSPFYTRRLLLHKNPRDIYMEQLLADGVDATFVKGLEQEYKSNLEVN
jgi:2-oxoglutarate dehydrogenase E1 component